MRAISPFLLGFFLAGCASSPPPPPPPYTPPTTNYGASSLLLKQGMTETQLLEILGPPREANLSTCGTAIGKPWQCKQVEFGYRFGGITVMMGEDASGAWRVNNWTVH